MPNIEKILLVSLVTPTIVFCLCIVIQIAVIRSTCAEGCDCGVDGYIINCEESGLQELPTSYIGNLKELYMRRNNLQKLETNAFLNKGIVSIEHLFLMSCNISSVDVDAFNGLTTIKAISLLSNLLTNLKVGTFKSMKQLQELWLGSNKLEKLEPGIFQDLMSLKLLDLSENHLLTLRHGDFSGLTNLLMLFLNSNELTYVDSDVFATLRLTKLIFECNSKLNIQDSYLYLNSSHLNHLDLRGCNVSIITENDWKSMLELETLSIDSENLQNIDECIISNNTKLSLIFTDSKSVDCNCPLLQFWRLSHSHNIDIIGYGKCDSPDQVSGKSLIVLEEAQCNSGNISFKQDDNFVYNNTNVDYESDSDEEEEGDDDDDDYNKIFVNIVLPTLYVVFFVFGVVGNALLMFMIVRIAKLRNLPNAYVFNLAIGDIMSLIMCVVFISSVTDTYVILSCSYLVFFRQLTIGLAVYLVVVLSVERYRVISRPFSLRLRPTFGIFSIVACWIISLLFALPSSMIIVTSQIDCIEYMTMPDREIVIIFNLIAFCLVPLCVTVPVYIMTARHLVRSATVVPGEIQHPKTIERKNTAKIVLSLAVVFMISYVPYQIMWVSLFYRLDSSRENIFYFSHASLSLTMLNSCFNPVALFSSSTSYRSHLKELVGHLCRKSEPALPVRSNRNVNAETQV